MSAAKGIQIRRVSITNAADMPKHGIAETPGGTMFGTTPGGTRIIYDRLFLLRQKESPAAKTPPTLPQIPGVTRDLDEAEAVPDSNSHKPRKFSVIEEEQTSGESRTNPSTSSAPSNNENMAEHQDEDAILEDEDELDMEL
jgi:hypothetical protein